jgi:tetratricopeptide (TPR) repeat protein
MGMEEYSKLRRFWESDRGNLLLSCQLIESYAKAGQFKLLEEFFVLALADIADQASFKLARAKAYLGAGSFDTAIELFSDCTEDPNHFRTYSIALCHYLKGDFSSALNHTNLLIKHVAIAPEIKLLHARCLYFLGEIGLAYDILSASINKASTAELQGLLAIVAYDFGKIEESQKSAQSALEKDPDQHDALVALASCELFFQRSDNARTLSKRALQLFNNSGRAWSTLGQSLLLANEIDNAHQAFSSATHFMPNHIGTWHLKAWCELIKEQYSSANESFNAALALNRNFADSHAGLAIICIHSDQDAEAQKLIKTAQKLDKNSFTAKYAQSLVARKAGDEALANNLIDDVLQHESHIDGTSHLNIIGMLTQGK